MAGRIQRYHGVPFQVEHFGHREPARAHAQEFRENLEGGDAPLARLSFRAGRFLPFAAPSLQPLRSGTGGTHRGNLTLLHCTRGTVLECKRQNPVLFVEDVGENLYSVDRMLQSLKLADRFERLQGMIVGCFTEMKGLNFGKSAEEIIHELLADYAYPVCFGFPAGHVAENYPLIMGATIEMEVTEKGTVIHFENNG